MSEGYQAVKENHSVKSLDHNIQGEINQGYIKIINSLILNVKELTTKISQLEVVNSAIINTLKDSNMFNSENFAEHIANSFITKSLQSEEIFKSKYGLKEVDRPIQKGDVVLLNLLAINSKTNQPDTESSLFRVFIEINSDEERFSFLTRFSDDFCEKLLGKSKNEKINSKFSDLKKDVDPSLFFDLSAEIEIIGVFEVPILN